MREAGQHLQRPSMARAIRARGEWKPKAMRARRRILVLADSTIAFERSWRRLLSMPWRWARDLVDADAGEIGEAVLPPLRVSHYPGDDEADAAPGDPHQFLHGGLRTVRRKP